MPTLRQNRLRNSASLLVTFLTLIGYAAAEPSGPVLTLLYAFQGPPTDAYNPQANLAVGSGPTGKPVLYGVTSNGGTGTHCLENCGTVYSLTPPSSPGGAWSETVLHNFTSAPDGGGPFGTLVIETTPAGATVLYGTTSHGGTGTACGLGCGTVFSLTAPASPGGMWTETVLYSFKGGQDGSDPLAGVTISRNSAGRLVLYGTTNSGGGSPNCGTTPLIGCGTVYALTAPASAGGAWTETMLYRFKGSTDAVVGDGEGPASGVVVGTGSAGQPVLYGTALGGGITSWGTVYALMPPTSTGKPWTEAILHRFAGFPTDGGDPQYATLVMDASGVLYGTTNYGGNSNCPASLFNFGCGAAFSLSPPATAGGPWTETLLHSFSGYPNDAVQPTSGLAIGTGGVLYGVTELGGNGCGPVGCGAVYSLTPPSTPGGSWSESVLYNFVPASEPYSPAFGAGVVIGGGLAGRPILLGVSAGGPSPAYYGTVYSFVP